MSCRLSHKIASPYGMDISTDKSKTIVNTVGQEQAEIQLNGVAEFQVPGRDALKGWQLRSGHSSKDHNSNGSNSEADEDMGQQYQLQEQIQVYKSLFAPVLLYGCETWILLTDTEIKIHAFEMKYLRGLFHISHRDEKSNDFVRSLVTIQIGPPGTSAFQRRKVVLFGHVARHDALPKTILQRRVEGGGRRGKQKT